jgi:hypothetical protein
MMVKSAYGGMVSIAPAIFAGLTPMPWRLSMKIGDLIKYHPDENQNQVPGLVLGFENIEASVDYLHVQWLDWTPGDIAVECASGLVVVSSANENR